MAGRLDANNRQLTATLASTPQPQKEHTPMMKTLTGAGALSIALLGVGVAGAHADESVNPPPPTFLDTCGSAKDSYVIPKSDKVSYFVNGVEVDAGSRSVDAASPTVSIFPVAKSGYTLTQSGSWSHTFDTGDDDNSTGCAEAGSTETAAPSQPETEPSASSSDSSTSTFGGQSTGTSSPTATELPQTGVDGPAMLFPGVGALLLGGGAVGVAIKRQRS